MREVRLSFAILNNPDDERVPAVARASLAPLVCQFDLVNGQVREPSTHGAHCAPIDWSEWALNQNPVETARNRMNAKDQAAIFTPTAHRCAVWPSNSYNIGDSCGVEPCTGLAGPPAVVFLGLQMNKRNMFFGVCAVTVLAAQTAEAVPAIPTADTPPLTVLFSSTYYTNIAGSSAALAAVRGLKRVDEVYSPVLELNFVEPMSGVSLFLAGQAGYDIHQQDSILNRERINLQAGADAKFYDCETTLMGSYGRYQSDLADLIVGTTKNTQELMSGELDATCNQSGRFIPSGSISETLSDNSASQYVPSNYRSTAGSASLQYQAGSLGAISLFGKYTQTNYPRRFLIVDATDVSDGYNLYAAGLRYERNVGSRINFTTSISESSLSRDNGLGTGFSGITYDVALAYHASGRLDLNLAASRQILPTAYLNAAYSVTETYSAGADYLLSSRLKVSLGALQTHSDFEGAALLPGVDLTDTTFRSGFGTLVFNVSPTFSVSLKGELGQRHADVLGYSYSGAQVGLSVSKAF